MIIYNKQIQNEFGVEVEGHKEISGKFKIGEKNGKGKEYNLFNNKMIFKGESKLIQNY